MTKQNFRYWFVGAWAVIIVVCLLSGCEEPTLPSISITPEMQFDMAVSKELYKLEVKEEARKRFEAIK